MSDPFLRFVDVYRSFGTNRVLRGVNLEVERGDSIVILGGSGSGKSVLLRHAIGLQRPDAGEVWVDGTEISELDEDELQECRKKVGMLFQAGALFDSMTVMENVAFALREHTDKNDKEVAERVREVLALVELEGVEEQMPADLSGGMRKRVALARAIAIAPRCLLYDEPTTGLDPITAGTINRLIRSLQERLGVTSVVVTHDIDSAFAVADRVAFLYEGRIEFHGTTAEARASDHPRLRAFLSGGNHGEVP